MPFDPIEKIGGSSRAITLLTLVIHFIHPLLCVANYLDWVRHQSDDHNLGSKLVNAYLAMTILACVFYLLVSSVFYMWAWRYPEPEEIAKRRRIYGIIGNLIISDFPIFMVEVQIVWDVQFATPLQGLSFVFTCISFAYSAFRVWTFIMVKVIKHQAPVAGAQSTYTGGRGFNGIPHANAYSPNRNAYSPNRNYSDARSNNEFGTEMQGGGNIVPPGRY